MEVLGDLITYLDDLRKLLIEYQKICSEEAFKPKNDKLQELLTANNIYLSDLLILKHHFSDFSNLDVEAIMKHKKFIKQIDELLGTFRIYNASFTAMLRAVTLAEKYKSETSELKVLLDNKYGTLYHDEIQDYYVLLHKRSGCLRKFCEPYLTRKENKMLAEKLYTKLKNIESTN